MKNTSLVLFILALFAVTAVAPSCTRASKKCKSSKKNISKMRKSGQIKM